MQEQRDKLIALKKAEREKKVRAEEERKQKTDAESDVPEAVLRAREEALSAGGAAGAEAGNAESMERRRAAMRMALARRMKLDLIESEEAKVAQLQEDQFAELDRKLQQVPSNMLIYSYSDVGDVMSIPEITATPSLSLPIDASVTEGCKYYRPCSHFEIIAKMHGRLIHLST
jgi:hypothetical protein